MPSLEEIIVCEYFELNGFLVLPLRKSHSQTKRAASEEGIDFYVQNLNYAKGVREPAFLLFSSELRYLDSAVICIRGWYEDKAALASMRDGSEMVKRLEARVLKKVEKWFEFDAIQELGVSTPPKKALLAPVFPAQEQYRSQCEAMLRSKGVDVILSFRSILLDIIDKVNTRHVYPKSDALQLIRLLKTFDLVKDSQMNFLS